MTTLLLLLSLLAVLCAGFVLALWRLLHPAAGSGPYAPGWGLWARPAAQRYRPVGRLLSDEDFAFVAAQSAGSCRLARRLRRQRLRILRLFLKQMRGDFARVYGLARMLAPTSQDPAFASRILVLAVQFSVLWVAVDLVSLVGWLGPVRGRLTGLVTALDRLSEAVRASLPPSQTSLALAPRM